MELCDLHGNSRLPAVTALRERFPSTILLGVPRAMRPLDLQEIVPLVRAGLHDLVFLDPSVDARQMVAGALTRAQLDSAEECVLRALVIPQSPDSRRLIETCVRRGRDGWGVKELANALGVRRSTLARRFRRVGLAPPARVLIWTRLLLAARLLEDSGRTVAAVAHELRYPSAAALRRTLKREADLRPAEVRTRGGFQRVLGRLIPEGVRRFTNAAAVILATAIHGMMGLSLDLAPWG